jgi:diacylglycerol kinase (ATP)
MKRRIAFVINPKSGADRKTDRVAFIRSLISDEYDSEVLLWSKITDKETIFSRVLHGNFDMAVAVGGDGTVSQLAALLAGTNIALGIIPFGSGNGLARHLGVPMDRKLAMKHLQTAVVKAMDFGYMNEHAFFCTAGIGFDARIGKLFAESSSRGFKTYTKITLREFKKYTAEFYSIELDGKKIEVNAFLITVANAGQYGNNAWIAPEANVFDGNLHVSVLKPFRFWNIPGIARKLFKKKIDQSKFVETYNAKSIIITRKEAGAIHYDGEPEQAGTMLHIRIAEKKLNVLVADNFKG